MPKKIPQRMCVGCREMKPKRELVRVVKPPEDGGVHLDLTGKASGRGAYVCKSAECLKRAVKTRALDRALEVKVSQETLNALSERIADEYAS